MTTVAPLSLPELHVAIASAQAELANLPNVSLATLEQTIQYHGARAQSIDPATAAHHRNELQVAIEAKEQAHRNNERRTEINHQLARLNQDLQLQQQNERFRQAGDATKRCEEAYADYIRASKEVVRAFRRVLSANRQAYNIKGAVTAPEDYSLHLPAIYSPYWQGTVGDHMRHAMMPFEQTEKDQSHG